jgi:subtilisin family serine protease
MVNDGWLVVASAGNNASCRLAYPAALPDVVAVGAISKCVPAWFSNYGPWVDVSARGVDVVAEFPTFETPGPGDGYQDTRVATDFDRDTDELQTYDLSDFTSGWAVWSGTSFSAPLVAARLAQELPPWPPPTDEEGLVKAIRGIVAGIIHRSDLDWLPYYGRILT